MIEIVIKNADEVRRALARHGTDANKVMAEVVKELLRETEQAQIKSYTQNSNPAKPPGSRYVRTFTLQRSSRSQIVQPFAPTVGRWDTDGSADYDTEVIGYRRDQKPVHRGRWKSLEEVFGIVKSRTIHVLSTQFRKFMRL